MSCAALGEIHTPPHLISEGCNELLEFILIFKKKIVSSSLHLISVYRTASQWVWPMFSHVCFYFLRKHELHIKQRKNDCDNKFSKWIFSLFLIKYDTICLKLLKQRKRKISVVLDIRRVALKMPLASTVTEPMTVTKTVNKWPVSCTLYI